MSQFDQLQFYWQKADGKSKTRFNLLLLEYGEHFYEDLSAFLLPVTTTQRTIQHCDSLKVHGRLKICSRSIIFESSDVKRPIIRYSYKYFAEPVVCMNTITSKSLTFDNSGAITFGCTSIIEMKQNSKVGPYVQVDEVLDEGRVIVVLLHADPAVVVSKIESLRNIYNVMNKDGRNAAEQLRIPYTTSMSSTFDTSLLVDFHETLKLPSMLSIKKISPMMANPGSIMITNSRVYYLPASYDNIDEIVRSFELKNIQQIYYRRYLAQSTSLEIVLTDGNSWLLCFEDRISRDYVYNIFYSYPAIRRGCDANGSITEQTIKWQKRELSNFEYLMYLNYEAGRSVNDLTQYPVFPHILCDFTSSSLDLKNPNTFRDLSKPIGALNPSRLEQFMERFTCMPPGDAINGIPPPFMYGTHYSTPGYILYYLVRVAPEQMLCLQAGKFDAADRMFMSIKDTWESCYVNPADLKELIPEFFCGNGEFLVNKESLDLGFRQTGERLGDVELPPWAKNPKDFIKKCRKALECDYVSERLHHWIDLIFGKKQTGQAAIDAHNVFYHLTYEGAIDLDNINNPRERAALEIQIQEFGQTPSQLFTTPHPSRNDKPVVLSATSTIVSSPSKKQQQQQTSILNKSSVEKSNSFENCENGNAAKLKIHKSGSVDTNISSIGKESPQLQLQLQVASSDSTGSTSHVQFLSDDFKEAVAKALHTTTSDAKLLVSSPNSSNRNSGNHTSSNINNSGDAYDILKVSTSLDNSDSNSNSNIADSNDSSNSNTQENLSNSRRLKSTTTGGNVLFNNVVVNSIYNFFSKNNSSNSNTKPASLSGGMSSSSTSSTSTAFKHQALLNTTSPDSSSSNIKINTTHHSSSFSVGNSDSNLNNSSNRNSRHNTITGSSGSFSYVDTSNSSKVASSTMPGFVRERDSSINSISSNKSNNSATSSSLQQQGSNKQLGSSTYNNPNSSAVSPILRNKRVGEIHIDENSIPQASFKDLKMMENSTNNSIRSPVSNSPLPLNVSIASNSSAATASSKSSGATGHTSIGVSSLVTIDLVPMCNCIQIFANNTTSGITKLLFYDKNSLCICCLDGNVRIIQIDYGAPTDGKNKHPNSNITTSTRRTFTASSHVDVVLSACIVTSDGKYVIAGGSDSSVYSFSIPSISVMGKYALHDDAVTAVCKSNNDQLLGTGSVDNSVRIWKMKDGIFVSTLSIAELFDHDSTITCLAISNCNNYIAAGGEDGNLIVWNIETQLIMFSCQMNKSKRRVTSLYWLPVNGSNDTPTLGFANIKLIAATIDGYMMCWDVNGHLIAAIHADVGITAMCVERCRTSTAGTAVASSSTAAATASGNATIPIIIVHGVGSDNNIYSWIMEGNTFIEKCKTNSGISSKLAGIDICSSSSNINNISNNDSNSMLIVSGSDGMIRLWKCSVM